MSWRGPGGALGEHEAGIDEYVAVADADQHAVHADLAQATDRQHPDRRPVCPGRTRELAGRVTAERRPQVGVAVAAAEEARGLLAATAAALLLLRSDSELAPAALLAGAVAAAASAGPCTGTLAQSGRPHVTAELTPAPRGWWRPPRFVWHACGWRWGM